MDDKEWEDYDEMEYYGEWDDALPTYDDDEPIVAEPEYPVHSYDSHCEVCDGPCYYEGSVPLGFCELHGSYLLDDEDGNCPNCLAIACDFSAGAYAGMDYIDGHYQ